MPLYDARLPRGDLPPLLYGPADAALAAPGAVPFPPYPPHCRRRVAVDAAGNEYDSLLWIDTETGELERYEKRDGGFVVDAATRRVMTVREKVPAPVELVPYAEEIP